MRKIICISGIFFGVTAALEYIVRAAKRRDDLEVITIGPFPGNWIAWNGGMVLPDKYIFEPDIILPAHVYDVPYEFLVNNVKNKTGKTPDLWLDVNAGFQVTGKNKYNWPRALYMTDPHVLRYKYNEIIPNYTHSFNPQINYQEGNEIIIPYGFDIEWHSPSEKEKLYDIALIGNTYGNRVNAFNHFSKHYRTFFGLGLAKDDAKELYNQSIIGLNWSSMIDITARCFELAGLGIIPFYNRVSNIELYFKEDEHFIGFSDQHELEQRVYDVLQNPEGYKQVGINARQNVLLNKHSWDNRLEEMLRYMNV